MPDRKTVLVVDDDVDLLGMVELLLDEAGYRVLTAAEGHEALDKLSHETPQMILLDMKMPGMNGWEFAREYRAKHNSRAPIIVFTAAEDARKRAEEIGAEGFLGKPFEIDELSRLVDRYTQRSA